MNVTVDRDGDWLTVVFHREGVRLNFDRKNAVDLITAMQVVLAGMSDAPLVIKDGGR